nr:RNA-directed DNA polymerase, eukaryota [Tanacetum cinerariifolium]
MVMSGSQRSKEDDVQKIFTSVFVRNFSDGYGAKDLWNTCKLYGYVVDVFIPDRRTKAGKVKEFASLTNLKVVLGKEGYANIELKYMGEVPGWVPDFEEDGKEGYDMNDESHEDDMYGGVSKNLKDVEGESDREEVFETNFKEVLDKSIFEGNSVMHNDVHSEDPFGIYEKRLTIGRNRVNDGQEDGVCVGQHVHERVKVSNDTHESICSGHFKKSKVPRKGGSLLELIDDLVKVGQTMGYDMTRGEWVSSGKRLLIISDGEVVIMGDFNEVYDISKRFGSIFKKHGAEAFNSFIVNAGLVEVPLGGCPFTWCHKSAKKMGKLDCFLISDNLMCSCPSISSMSLDIFLSDHQPIIMREAQYDYGPIPFKFIHYWFELDGFDKLHKKSLNSRKGILKAELADLDGVIDKGEGLDADGHQRREVVRLIQEAEKNDDLEREVSNEEMKRAVWDCGIDNAPGPDGFTFDFYRQYWDIIGNDVVDAVKCSYEGASKYGIYSYAFFNGADVNSKKPSWVRWKSVLAAKDVGGLGVSSLFALNRALMFKWVWRFFSQKNSLWVRVVKALHGEDMKIGKKVQPRKLIDNANIVKDFRPISLIRSLYKVIAKVLANRLVTVLDDIVDEIQSAFVTDRQILDGPFIFNEIVHWCKNKKKQSMIFKVDFENVYDSVRWDIIDDILRRFGIGEKWCKWIQSCLYSSRGSVLVNVSPTKDFQFHKGLKYGDPLSPFLFILVMESLHVLFQIVVDVDLFNGIKLDSSLQISHLFFADDAIFMGQWSQCNIDTIIRVLDVFYRASGLRINMNKSNLMGISADSNKVKHAAAKIGASKYGIYSYAFFNGVEINSKKPSWVRWKSVLAAKDVGGLGVSSLFALNRALMFKWVWRVFSQKNSLWVRVVKALHGEDRKIGKKVQPRYPSTWLNIIIEIKSLKLHGIDLVSFITPKLGNGVNTLFWDVAWCGDIAFKNLVPRLYALESMKNIEVASKLTHGVIYKVLANRLVTVLDDIFDEIQSAFVTDRQILDDPFILNEIVHWCKNKKKQSMIFKVDFEKAYDSVRWDFIDVILRRFDFEEKWCKWIQSCLYSSRGSVLINDSPTKEFQFHKGLKQGDPLSPFLFIFVMESLRVSFQRVMDAGLFNGIKLDSSLQISHLFYADDAIFMGQWSQCNIDTIIRVLDVFYRASGLRINMNKSNLICISMDSNKVKHAAAKIGYLVLKTPLNYLGSRVGDLMSRIKSWHDVNEGMHTRLSKWKLKTLSVGGRLTLLKSVLGAIPIYHMSIFKVPMKMLQNMESIRARFFNGADINSKKPSWIRWKSVLAAKDVGGLGVSSLFVLNRALMFKWVLRFFSQKNPLWVRVVKALHGEDGKIGKKDVAWCGDIAFKNLVPRLYALESMKNIDVASKLSHGGLEFSFRRNPRGGLEQAQFERLKEMVEGVTLS